MKPIIIINGNPFSGKDEFIQSISKYIKTFNISSVDIIKKAANILGWDNSKTEKDRKFLSDLKLLCIQYNNHPYQYIKQEIENFYKSQNEVMFIHIREPEEIKKVVKDFGAFTLIVKRPEYATLESNESDKNIDEYKYDYQLTNDGDLKDLDKKAQGFARYLKEFKGD